MGKVLYGTTIDSDGRATFVNNEACNECSCKCVKKGVKQFKISVYKKTWTKEYNDKDLHVRQIHIKADKEIVSKRKEIVEHPFGTIKRTMDSGYLLMKGLQNVTGELSLTFLAYNMKRVINILGTKNLVTLLQGV